MTPLKPGKPPPSMSSYRALTSCLCKTFEKMIGARLTYVLEKNCFLNKYQCSFRASHSTLDHLVRFETTVRYSGVEPPARYSPRGVAAVSASNAVDNGLAFSTAQGPSRGRVEEQDEGPQLVLVDCRIGGVKTVAEKSGRTRLTACGVASA